MQVVILAGGRGTRLGALTSHRPKALVEIAGRPFLSYQLDWLARFGLTDVVLCVGHLAEPIKAFAQDGSAFGMRIQYAEEAPDCLLGTAGALKQAEPFLEEQFCVLNGDSYLPLDPRKPVEEFARRQVMALMVVFKNRSRYDASNAVVENGWVTFYSRRHPERPGVEFIDYGLRVFSKGVLGLIPAGRHADLDDLYQELVAQRQLAAYEVREPFYEIGSPSGLARFARGLQEAEVRVT